MSCHRRLRISEALELGVEGGRVCHSWCMFVVSHGFGWLGEAGMEVVDGMHAVQSQEGMVACQEMSEHFPCVRRYIDDTRSHRLPCMVGSTSRFVVEHATDRRLR